MSSAWKQGRRVEHWQYGTEVEPPTSGGISPRKGMSIF